MDYHIAPKERGGILLFVALTLVVIFGFIALGIDVTRMQGASSEQLFTADHLALGAVQVYLDYEPTQADLDIDPLNPPNATQYKVLRHKVKYEKAIDRVLQLGALNKFAGMNNRAFISHPSELGSGLGAETDQSFRAAVVPGRWWQKRPESCSNAGVPSEFATCPCSIDNNAIPDPQPCFQPCDPETGCINLDATQDPPYANAFRVTLKMRPGEGIQNVAAGVLGQKFSYTSGSSVTGAGGSIAASLPKYGVLLLDLGRPMTIDAPDGPAKAYLPKERGNPSAREYAYRLIGQPPGCNSGGEQVTLLNSAWIWEPTVLEERIYKASYNGLSPTQKSQYHCYKVKVNGSTEHYLVATGATAPEPQPLTNMMRALHTSLVEMQKSANSADRIAVLGYDQRKIPERFFEFTNTESEDFKKLLKITDVDTGRVEAAKAGFFPMPGSKSDLAGGVLEAYKQLSDEVPLQHVDPFISLYSNGLSQCERITNPNAVTCSRYARVSDSIGVKDRLYETHKKALAELTDVIAPTIIRPNGIKVHVITAGAKTLAQSVLIRNPANPSTCLSDYELRQYGYMNVVTGGVTNSYPTSYLTLGDSDTGVYEQSGYYLYAFAMQSQGDYFPWRPRCIDSYGPGYLGVYSDINALCRTGSIAPAPTVNDRALNTRARAIKNSSIPAKVIDSQGRLLCSPTVETPKINMEAAVGKIMEIRPVFLVSRF